DQAERALGMRERIEQRQMRTPRVATDNPALVPKPAPQGLHVVDQGRHGPRPARSRAPASALVEAVNLRQVVDERGHRLEIVVPARTAVAKQKRHARAGYGRPDYGNRPCVAFSLGLDRHTQKTSLIWNKYRPRKVQLWGGEFNDGTRPPGVGSSCRRSGRWLSHRAGRLRRRRKQ